MESAIQDRVEKPFRLWLVLLFFKLSWASLVIFREKGVIPGVILIVLMLVISRPRLYPCLAILSIALYGILIDAILTLAGFFVFTPTPAVILPAWLCLLWLSLGTVATTGKKVLITLHPVTAKLLGAVSGCFGYGAGYLLGAVDFSVGFIPAMLILALIWCHFPVVWAYGLSRLPVPGAPPVEESASTD